MDAEIVTWIWFAAGLLLVAIEFFAPGLVVIFMGLASIAVAILRWVGALEGLSESFIAWMIMSIVLVATLRKAGKKWFPSEPEHADIDEDRAAFGQTVVVLADCDDAGTAGRIRFQGTSWPAMTTEGVLRKGDSARIVFRDNLAWVIEPIDAIAELEAPSSETVPLSSSQPLLSANADDETPH